MKKYLLMTSGLAALMLTLQSAGYAQQTETIVTDTAVAAPRPDGGKEFEEIIIRRNNNKDAKVNIEIKGGKVFINGKPSSEYKDANVTVRRLRTDDINITGFGEIFDGNDVPPPPAIAGVPGAPGAPAAPGSPFRNHSGTFSFGGDAWGDDVSTTKSTRAFLGVTSETEDDGKGARITQISRGSAAEKVGLKTDDIITRIDDIKIDGPESLSAAVRKYKPEDKVTVTFTRNGKEQKLTAVLGKTKTINAVKTFNYTMPRLEGLDIAPRAYGFGYGESKPKLGIKAQDTEDGKGVKVLEVGDESAAEKAGVKEGDIITKFDGKEIDNAGTLADLARENKDKPSIKLSVIRDGKPLDIDVKIPRKLKTANL